MHGPIASRCPRSCKHNQTICRFLIKRITTDRDWDQLVGLSLSSLDAYARSFVLDTRGVNQVNH